MYIYIYNIYEYRTYKKRNKKLKSPGALIFKRHLGINKIMLIMLIKSKRKFHDL